MSGYESLKVPQLKVLLKERSLKTTGKKTELIDRLKEHDIHLKREQGLILLFCKTMIGSYYDTWVKSSDTVLTLKELLSQRTNIPVAKLELEYENYDKRSRLHNEDLLADYNIAHESTIFIIQRL